MEVTLLVGWRDSCVSNLLQDPIDMEHQKPLFSSYSVISTGCIINNEFGSYN